MLILPRPSLVLPACGLVLAGILLGLLAVSPSLADVGVRPILPGGSSLKPEEETPIQMASELVVMTVRQATEADNAAIHFNPEAYGLRPRTVWFPAIAEVKADFTMRNPTSEAVSMTAWFPLASTLENVAWDELNPEEIVPRIQSFRVTQDGHAIAHTVSELPNPKGADKPSLPWASFPLTFPAGTDTIIHVSYLLPLHHSIKGYELALYYIFQTGAGWAGPIGQAELTVNLPYPASPETLAGMPSGGLNLPYFISDARAGIPSGGELEGNQARWTWTDFEPGPEDDFAVWLIDLDRWRALETARAAVQAKPENGQAWLDLADLYHSLSVMAFNGYHRLLVFSASYLPLGIEAYQKAADLLPEHPAPHIGLALLTLAPYMADLNAAPEVIQSVQDELTLARELEARSPSLAEEADVSSWMVAESLNNYTNNAATATAVWVTRRAFSATETAVAEWINRRAEWATKTALATVLETPSATPTKKPPPQQPIPSATPLPSPTVPPTPREATGQGQGQDLIVVGGLVGLVILGSLALKRMRGRTGK